EIVKYDSGNNNNNNNNIDTLAVYHHSTPTTLPDPPGEAPTNHPIVCTDLMIDCAGSSRNSYNNNYSSRSQYCSSNNYQNTVLWMDPKNVHDPNMVDWNVLRRYDDLMSSSASSSSASTNSSTVAPSSSSPPLPSQSSSSYHHPTTSTATHHPLLLSNPRTRIATISTGFTAATFFVREDLDTRIYFNQLEDAIGYMGRRGYVKMNKEEEREWRSILECAHKVVKVGPTKRKQLYRKGKIVLILKKTIVNEGIEGDYHNHVKKSWSKKQLMIESGANHGGGEVGGVLTVRRTKKKQMEEEDESQATTTTTPSTNDNDDSNCSTSSDSSSSSGSDIRRKNNNFSNFKKLLDSSAASASACSTADQTDRTSLGRSTRWPYKSYSEKFLAQQDEEKRQCLLAIMEGRPLLLENGAGADPSSLLLLTDGGNEYCRTGPIDPDADIIPSSGRSGCNYDDDDWRNSSAQFSSTSVTATATNGMLEESQRSFYSKLHGGSTSHRGSARRGVYGGGVRYFTPDYSQYSESDEEEEDGGNVGEESGDDEGALYEAEEEEDFQTSDDIESTNDSAFVVEEEEEVAPFFVTESKKREKSMKKKEKKKKKEEKKKMKNRTRNNNSRRSQPVVASL
ncbi:hypothetical protein ACHAXH_008679, partial [Discostella pseudostelligera]